MHFGCLKAFSGGAALDESLEFRHWIYLQIDLPIGQTAFFRDAL